MDIQDMFIGLSRKENRYQPGGDKKNQSCQLCRRKHYSFPDTCNDGWPGYKKDWVDRGADCINFIPTKQ